MDERSKIGQSVVLLDTPALLVDLDQLKANVQRMAGEFEGTRVKLRPHIKTHKCPQIAQMQLDAGAIGITCAKVSEAEVFAKAGIEDILIANQITGEVKIKRLVSLARKCNLKVAVDNPDNVDALNAACKAEDVRLGVLVEVNIGMQRCGVEPGKPTLALSKQVDRAANLDFLGFQAYEGHLVLVKDSSEREKKVAADFIPLQETIELVEEAGLNVRIVSGGGTGTFDLAVSDTPLTEIQVGSYVLMDQTYNTVREEFPPAITVMSTVVSRPVPERLVTDAGLKAMSSEFGWPGLLGIEAEMNYLSEEHAVLTLSAPDEVNLAGGDRVRYIPSHVCTTVNLHDRFYVHQNGQLVDIWEISARGCCQ